MAPFKEGKNNTQAAFTFPFGSTNCIRFKGYYLSPLKDTPKVAVNLSKSFLNRQHFLIFIGTPVFWYRSIPLSRIRIINFRGK
ncbi:hypothetical protein J2W55_002981 [Mucilaginibacter pocheonensis]|uniref:Uncharacterized protein n=1 Tax=Mucilaginibacter pocheonensis TaxID=398050 RepID=A0ABU1TCK0_9SPHI|nr:hypothetical protein [Mucilaginibacter pocheonensis]